jgi:hypothetical protein
MISDKRQQCISQNNHHRFHQGPLDDEYYFRVTWDLSFASLAGEVTNDSPASLETSAS